MHSLFQALKQDGLGTSTSSAGTASANLVSSLHTLIAQVGSGGAAGSTTANLSAAYQNLLKGTGAGSAAPAVSTGVSTAQSGTTGLQNFLGNLLQNLQAGGVHALSSIGNNVNAKV
jgi:hypothetical protein